MEFHLSYEGPLKSASGPENKHAIRKALHPQLKELWRRTPFLSGQSSGSVFVTSRAFREPQPHTIEDISARFTQFGFKWVPLVTENMSLFCEIDVIFLRYGDPGALVTGGDLDGRLKTLFDALRKPQQAQELKGATPDDSEDPFFCLLEDDKLITKLSTTTSPLLEPRSEKRGMDHAKLLIKVVIRPYEMHGDNIGFS